MRDRRKRRTPHPLKLRIVELGVVQADIADATGISQPRLSGILNSRIVPKPAEEADIEAYLDEVATETILGDDDTPGQEESDE